MYDFSKCKTLADILTILGTDNKKEETADKKLLQHFHNKGITTPYVKFLENRYKECIS